MIDIEPYLMRIKERASQEPLKKEFESFNRKVLFTFTDTGESYVVAFNRGDVTVSKGQDASAEVQITTTTDVLAGIMDKKTNPVTVYIARKIKVKGEMQNLLKLQKLL
ncbi:MAG: SCP2 sterol-binding domain-containing protein [Nitrososphaeria archaeon]|jgi:putative sterol carrier protein